MPQSQPRERAKAATPRRPARRRLEYIAAVRFKDGERQLFSVSNAHSAEEARSMVLDEISNVASVVVALR